MLKIDQTRAFATTTLDIEECKFTWTVHNFDDLTWIGDLTLESPLFCAWKLELNLWHQEIENIYNPNYGRYEDKKQEDMSLTLKYCGKEEVESNFKIGIVKQDGELYNELLDKHVFNGNDFTCAKFAKKSSLLNDVKQILADGALKIRCEITFIKKISHSCVAYQSADKNKHVAATIRKNFEILCKEIPADVTLFVENEEFKVHKCILTAASPVFGKMLENENEVTLTEFYHVKKETMQSLIRYIYHGNVEDLSLEHARDLYHAAKLYQIGDLASLCADYIKNKEASLCKYHHFEDF